MIEKEGWEKMYKTEVVISNLIFLNKRSDFEWAEEKIEEDMVDIDSDMF
jgi:hypothetical protein